METLKCHLWSARRAQPLAELSQAERSEAQPREARPPPKAAAPVSSIPWVFLGRLVLVMHSTLIGYAIGYLPNQDPTGYPGLLI